MTQTPVSIDSLLHTKPGFRQGRPCLAGTGVTVHTVAALHNAGYDPARILESFPHLDLPRIYAALAYYLANKEQVDAEIAEDLRWADDMTRRFPHGWRGEPLVNLAGALHPADMRGRFEFLGSWLPRAD